MTAALALAYEPLPLVPSSPKLASGSSALSGKLASALLAMQPANDTGENRRCACDIASESLIWVSKDPTLFRGGLNVYAYCDDDPVNWIDPRGDMKLPPNPSGLGPGWEKDEGHKDPNGERWVAPDGSTLDWHPAQPVPPGVKPGRKWKYRDHWHHDGEDAHLVPGTEVEDPAPVCKETRPASRPHDAVDPDDEGEGEGGEPSFFSPLPPWWPSWLPPIFFPGGGVPAFP